MSGKTMVASLIGKELDRLGFQVRHLDDQNQVIKTTMDLHGREEQIKEQNNLGLHMVFINSEHVEPMPPTMEQLWYVSHVYPETITPQEAHSAFQDHLNSIEDMDDQGALLHYWKTAHEKLFGRPIPVPTTDHLPELDKMEKELCGE